METSTIAGHRTASFEAAPNRPAPRLATTPRKTASLKTASIAASVISSIMRTSPAVIPGPGPDEDPVRARGWSWKVCRRPRPARGLGAYRSRGRGSRAGSPDRRAPPAPRREHCAPTRRRGAIPPAPPPPSAAAPGVTPQEGRSCGGPPAPHLGGGDEQAALVPHPLAGEDRGTLGHGPHRLLETAGQPETELSDKPGRPEHPQRASEKVSAGSSGVRRMPSRRSSSPRPVRSSTRPSRVAIRN